MSELSNLPRLGEDAMSPCVGCGRQLLETGLPIFNRITIEQCGIDGNAVRQHVGLALAMGGGRDGLILADVLGPGVKPVVVVQKHMPVNICHECGMRDDLSMLELLAKAIDRQTGENDDADED